MSALAVRRAFFAGLVALVVLVQLPLVHRYFFRREPASVAVLPFEDTFDGRGAAPGPAWFTTGGLWRIEDGVLLSPGVKNNPLWLQVALPPDVRIELDARSESADGDLKLELFGNGLDHASGYVLVFGGWRNTISVIARLDEHGADRKERRDVRVERGRTYHMSVERRGGRLTWQIDGDPFLEYDDPAPLAGPGHDRFGFSSWDAELLFDNLRIEAL